jgi:hypothetical protein
MICGLALLECGWFTTKRLRWERFSGETTSWETYVVRSPQHFCFNAWNVRATMDRNPLLNSGARYRCHVVRVSFMTLFFRCCGSWRQRLWMWRQKKVGELRDDIGVIRQALIPFFKKSSFVSLNKPPDHLLLDSAPNLGLLISRWEINKFENCWYKIVRILEVLMLLFQQFLNLPSSQQDMRGPILGALSNNRWSWGRYFFMGNVRIPVWQCFK